MQRIFSEPSLSESELAAATERDTVPFRIDTASREALESRVLFRGIHTLLEHHRIPEAIVEHLLYWPLHVMIATLDRLAELDAEGASGDAKIGEASMAARYGEIAFGPVPTAPPPPTLDEITWDDFSG